MRSVKIFLDDTRDAPLGSFCCVSTYEDCIILLSAFSNDVEFLDLDYYLGEDSKCSGLDVLVFMKEHGIHPNHINIHSSHETGAPKMLEYVRKYFPNSLVTTNKFRV